MTKGTGKGKFNIGTVAFFKLRGVRPLINQNPLFTKINHAAK